MTIEAVTLTTGAVAPKGAVLAFYATLKSIEREALAGNLGKLNLLFEIALFAREGKTQAGAWDDELREIRFIDARGRMHDVVRDVVLAAVVADEVNLDIRVVNPVAQPS